MKKLLTLTMSVLFSCTVLGANANWLNETNKALYKANKTVSTVNQVDKNVKKANTKEAKKARKQARAKAKAEAKAAAKREAQYQTNNAINKLFK